MRGVLFQNDKVKDTQPDYKGSINVDGKDYWINMWDKVAKSGQAYYSLSVQPKEDKGDDMYPDKSGHTKAREVADRLRQEPEEKKINLDDIPF